MKRRFSSVAVCIVLFIALSITAFAYEKTTCSPVTWEYSTYNAGTYVPKTGWAQSVFYKDTSYGNHIAENYCVFSLDDYNVENILLHNNGEHPESNKTLFLGVDITSVRNSLTDKMSAYLVVTNLPNPKTDLEDEDALGTRNEESEVVALGEVEADTEYYMYVLWNDYREGGSSDDGQWQVQFNMSGRYIGKGAIWIPTFSGDYNNVWTAVGVQAILPYGNEGGEA